MAYNTKIEWCERTWSPITGCTKISPGCQNCYAERITHRLAGRYGYPAIDPFKVTLHSERLNDPIRWRKPSRVFVCSMGDLFHEDVPDYFIAEVFRVMRKAKHHQFMVLTKRPIRLLYFSDKVWPKDCGHIWLGVTAENQEQADLRIPILLQIPAAVRFVSVEPMLGPVDLTQVQFDAHTTMNVLEGCGITTRPGARGQSLPNIYSEKINWVICGGESGHGARPMHPGWARSLRDQCQETETAFFFKQWGEWAPSGCIIQKVGKKKAGRLLDGREWNEMPKAIT